MNELPPIITGNAFQQHSVRDRNQLIHKLYLPNGRLVTFNEKGYRISDIRYELDENGNYIWDKPVEDIMVTEQNHPYADIFRSSDFRYYANYEKCEIPCQEEIDVFDHIIMEYFDGSKHKYLDEATKTEDNYGFLDFTHGNVIGSENTHGYHLGVNTVTIRVVRTVDAT